VPEQLVRMAYAVLRLSQRTGLRGIGGWVHMRGFRGHFVTKSHGCSANLGTLRADRAAYRAQQEEPDHVDDAADEDSTPVVAFWQYLGSDYLNPGDALLAAGVEASLRAAREALLDVRRGPATGRVIGLRSKRPTALDGGRGQAAWGVVALETKVQVRPPDLGYSPEKW
jgi:hypothetical protein